MAETPTCSDVDPLVTDSPAVPLSKQWRTVMNHIIFTQKLKATLQPQLGNNSRIHGADHHVETDEGINQSGFQSVDERETGQPSRHASRRQPPITCEESEFHSVRSSRQHHPAQNAGSCRQRSSRGASFDADRSQFDFVKSVHQALVQRFAIYGVILTLLTSITFMVFLQPPGSVDGATGTMRSNNAALDCFVFFSTVSFMLACTGVVVVSIGSASLLPPKRFCTYDTVLWKVDQDKKDDPSVGAVIDKGADLAVIVDKNLERVGYLRLYTTLSLCACIAAFICAGLAITESSGRTRSILIAGIALGGLPLTVEASKYLNVGLPSTVEASKYLNVGLPLTVEASKYLVGFYEKVLGPLWDSFKP